MNRLTQKMRGVTLLEIMLVLAIAALLVVMSVRYYQSTRTSQQVDAMVEQIQSIVQAADGIAQEQGYSATAVTTSAIGSTLPANAMTSPWGTPITVAVTSATTFTITTTNVPAGVCSLLVAKYNQNKNFDTTAISCPSSGNLASFVITYNSGA